MKNKLTITRLALTLIIGIIAALTANAHAAQINQLNQSEQNSRIAYQEVQEEVRQAKIEPVEKPAAKAKKPTLAEKIKNNVNKCDLATEHIRADNAECVAIEQVAEAVPQESVAARTTPVTVVAAPVGNIEQIVRDAAVRHGVNPDHLVQIAVCESKLDASVVNYNYYENGHPSGIFQHISGYWPARAAQYGYAGASVFDAVANANVTAQMFAAGQSYLWEC